jgi:hypothetical protein
MESCPSVLILIRLNTGGGTVTSTTLKEEDKLRMYPGTKSFDFNALSFFRVVLLG